MKVSTLTLSTLALVLTAAAAQAQSVAALVGDKAIALVDVKTLKAGKAVVVTGAEGALLGIDVRPADGKLYGLMADGTVVTINPTTGVATKGAKLDSMLKNGTAATVDFNPVADRLRVIGIDGTNLRANVDDGKVTTDGALKFAETDMHKGETPKVVAGAYTNSVKGAKETALYDIDVTIGGLLKQAPPNDGVLTAVGKLGVAGPTYAFDIIANADGSNDGWLMASDTLYKVDLATGKSTSVGKITGLTGPVRDIAILPAM